MSYILDKVKGHPSDMIQRLQLDISGICLGVIAHGDNCDEKVFYQNTLTLPRMWWICFISWCQGDRGMETKMNATNSY